MHSAQPLDSYGNPILVYTSQVLRAARPRFVEHGGLMSSFLAQFSKDSDANDGSYEATRAAFAPAGGVLYSIIEAYLTSGRNDMPSGLGISTDDATAILVRIWSDATTIRN